MLSSDISVCTLRPVLNQFNFQPRFHVGNLKACTIVKKGHVITFKHFLTQNTTHVTDLSVLSLFLYSKTRFKTI